MCNPRRIRVHATRKIAEAWRAEIEQAATARNDVSSEARLAESIGDLLPPPARIAFEQAMQAAADWVFADGQYFRSVPGGQVSYRPDTGELEIVIRLETAIEAVGTASLVASGEVTGEVTVEASSTYYSDGFRGRTKDSATKKAQQAAEAKAEEVAARRREALKFEAEERARHELNQRTEEAKAEARLSAERQLTLQVAEARRDLDEQASQQLELVQAETLKSIFQLVAAGYSNALQIYAAEHGENLQVSEEDGVIEIQFEMEQ